MADDDIEDMADVLGAEHFPDCACFKMAGRGRECRMEMYVSAQEYADGFVRNMFASGICAEAMPYYIALFVSMCVSMISSHRMGGRDVDAAGLAEFGEMQRQMFHKIRERTDALMRRSDNITLGSGEGTTSVQ